MASGIATSKKSYIWKYLASDTCGDKCDLSLLVFKLLIHKHLDVFVVFCPE